MKIYKNLTELIGKTPILLLENIMKKHNLSASLLGKLEGFNPAGSVKDRIALAIIEDAERAGLLCEDSVIVEPTSGNTGIGLAAAASVRGYRVILTMPENMSLERRSLLRTLGAELVLTEGSKGMKGAIDKANELAGKYSKAFIPGQFSNPINPKTHRETTGPEIWADTEGKVDIFVAGIGTGGTITGAGGFLKEMNPALKIAAVEPAYSPVLSGGTAGIHGIQGIGAGFVPKILDTGIYDEIIAVTDEDAFESLLTLAATEGLLAGISSGAALWAAITLAKRPENEGMNIVVILPDTGERYLSMPIFSGGHIWESAEL